MIFLYSGFLRLSNLNGAMTVKKDLVLIWIRPVIKILVNSLYLQYIHYISVQEFLVHVKFHSVYRNILCSGVDTFCAII
jgi:hypothetical protein